MTNLSRLDNGFGRFCAGLLLARGRSFEQALKRDGRVFRDDQRPNLFRAALLPLFRGLLSLDDGQRVARAIRRVDGKWLQYRESVDNPPYLVEVQQPPAPFDGEGVILNPYGDIDLGKPE